MRNDKNLQQYQKIETVFSNSIPQGRNYEGTNGKNTILHNPILHDKFGKRSKTKKKENNFK